MNNSPTCSKQLAVLTYCLLFSFLFSAFYMTAITDAYADPGTILCNVAILATGKFGAAVCTLAVITLGCMALFGRATWGHAILIAVGIACVGGAATIITTLTNWPDNC